MPVQCGLSIGVERVEFVGGEDECPSTRLPGLAGRVSDWRGRLSIKAMRQSLFLIALSLFASGSAIISRAQHLQVIKDSEAAQYVGKNVEVRGLVVVVFPNKNGNTF
jgi:hypothetical protein